MADIYDRGRIPGGLERFARVAKLTRGEKQVLLSILEREVLRVDEHPGEAWEDVKLARDTIAFRL